MALALRTTVTMLLDVRERALAEALDRLGLEYETTPLAIGDIEITTPEITVRIERKTWEDMWASIRDGRFREQRERLRSDAMASKQIVYCLEGALPTDAEIRKTCVGAALNLINRDGFGVVRSWNVDETAYWVGQCVRKVEQGEWMWPVGSKAEDCKRAHDQGLYLSVRRAGNLDNETLFALQWSVIPGISMEQGRFLAAEFRSWQGLLARMAPLDEKAQKALLAGLRPPQGKRCLGPKLAERILHLVLGTEERCQNSPDGIKIA